MDMPKGAFHFIATVLDVQAPLPFEITPRVRLEKAQGEQLLKIKAELDALAASGIISRSRDLYENHWKTQRTSPQAISYVSTPLSPDAHRYFVLTGPATGSEMLDVLRVASALRPNLSSFVHFHTEEPFAKGNIVGRGFDPIGIPAFYMENMGVSEVLAEIDLVQLKEAVERYQALDQRNHEGIRRAFEYHSYVSRLSNLGYLKVLGMFAVIEMLLTHNPHDKEVGDSLTHQIKKKMALLDSRFASPLDYGVFGSQIHSDKTWAALYGFRSAIAHGDHVDFQGKNKTLVSYEVAYNFLAGATRSLLIHAAYEPDLVNALKPI